MPNRNNNNMAHHNNNTPNSNAKHMSNSNNQPINTIQKSSSLLTLCETISELQKVFNIPSMVDSKSTSVTVSSYAPAQSAASVCKSASSSSSAPSHTFRDSLSALKTASKQPAEIDSTATSG